MPLERVKQFKDITLHYDGSSGSLLVKTDLPGGTLTTQRTLTIPSTSGEATETFPLDSPSLLEGTLIQVRVNANGVMRLLGGVARFRVIGVYFDGSKGEYWETQPMGLGV